MGRFAAETSVSIEKSLAEIKKLVTKYGASQFAYMECQDQGKASVQFLANERMVRFLLRLPIQDAFAKTPGRGQRRSNEAKYAAWEQACKQRWRALCLCIKAKLEAVESNISTFEDEFMAHILLPNGQTVSEILRPQLAEAYQNNRLPQGIAGFLTSEA